jgi:hypothetical protein
MKLALGVVLLALVAAGCVEPGPAEDFPADTGELLEAAEEIPPAEWAYTPDVPASAGVDVAVPVDIAPESGAVGEVSAARRPTTGRISISDDYGYIYVGGGYVGRGNAVVTVYPGVYTVTAKSPSTGRTCWRVNARVTAGRTTIVRQSVWCK